MPFDWEEFLKIAEFLKQYTGPDFTSEAALRSSVGLAYYAAFGVARAVARSEGYIGLESAEDHQRLRDHFDRTRRTDVGTKLTRLRQWRNQADYSEVSGNLQMMAKESIAEAHRVINRLRAP